MENYFRVAYLQPRRETDSQSSAICIHSRVLLSSPTSHLRLILPTKKKFRQHRTNRRTLFLFCTCLVIGTRETDHNLYGIDYRILSRWARWGIFLDVINLFVLCFPVYWRSRVLSFDSLGPKISDRPVH